MTETTPGPLITVTQFVGFLAGYCQPGALGTLAAATLAAMLTTWVTFLPSFLWIFAGAPFIEKLRGNLAVSGAMSAITAAVAGVILNLAVWFGLHCLVPGSNDPHIWAVDGRRTVLASLAMPSVVLAALAIFRFKQSVIVTLLRSAVLGLAWSLLAA
jgi:chromate transporter